MSSSLIANSPLVTQASRQTQQLTQHASRLGTEASTQKRSIGSISSVNVVLDAIKNNQFATLTGCDGAIGNAIAYLQNAQASLQEQRALVQSALTLATNAATDPSLTAQLTTLNTQFMNALAQIQAVTTTTHDAAGNAILTGVVGSYATTASAELTIINTAGANIFSGNTVATPGVATAATEISASLAGLSAVAGVHGNPSVITSLTNAANTEIALGAGNMTISNFLASALAIIPSVALDPSQIAQQVSDAVRAEKIAGALPDVLARALLASAQLTDVPATVVGYLTNTSRQASGHANGAADGMLIAIGDVAACAAFAGLLTATEIAAIKNLATTGALNAPSAAANSISVAMMRNIITEITCCANIGLQGNDASLTGMVLDVGTGNNNLVGTAVALGVALGTYNDAQTVIAKYVTNAALAYVGAATAQQKVQIGLNATDIVQLQINSTTQAALGLSASTITNVANAQTAMTSLQTALQRIANNLSNINSQVNQLTGRDTSINTQIDSLNEQISMIENTDLVENASQLNGINSSIATVGALIQLSAAIRQTIAQAAQQILRG